MPDSDFFVPFIFGGVSTIVLIVVLAGIFAPEDPYKMYILKQPNGAEIVCKLGDCSSLRKELRGKETE